MFTPIRFRHTRNVVIVKTNAFGELVCNVYPNCTSPSSKQDIRAVAYLNGHHATSFKHLVLTCGGHNCHTLRPLGDESHQKSLIETSGIKNLQNLAHVNAAFIGK